MQNDHQPAWVRAYRRAVGDRIRAYRLAANFTQIDLSYACGIDRTTYQRIESGESDLRLGDLALIADAVGVPAWELLRTTAPESSG